jgi:XTP/dITP diphosphohydrolase
VPELSRRLVLATRNPHKLAEMSRILAPSGIEVQPLADAVLLPPENGTTFASNALAKARAAADALGAAAFADDSGIEAAALHGAPGVRSARYAGECASDEENLRKLMSEVPAGSGLTYRCVVAYAEPGGVEERLFFGECRGVAAGERRGAGGFGYDPAFVPCELPAGVLPGTTMAELTELQKDQISHRGRAARSLAAWLLS